MFTGLALLVVNSPGWQKVKQEFFNPAEFRAWFRDVGHAFVLNIKIFLVAEVLILILALVLAVLRSLPGPVFFPIRLLAIVYTDVFRGIPTILVVYLLGFGVPALQLAACHHRPGLPGRGGAGAGLLGVRGRGLPGRHRVGAPQPGGGGPLAGPDARADAADVILPQAVRRVIPPLLNDFIGLQKDTALVSVLGPVEALQRATLGASATSTTRPTWCAAVLLRAITIPQARFTDWLIARDRRRQMAGGRA